MNIEIGDILILKRSDMILPMEYVLEYHEGEYRGRLKSVAISTAWPEYIEIEIKTITTVKKARLPHFLG